MRERDRITLAANWRVSGRSSSSERDHIITDQNECQSSNPDILQSSPSLLLSCLERDVSVSSWESDTLSTATACLSSASHPKSCSGDGDVISKRSFRSESPSECGTVVCHGCRVASSGVQSCTTTQASQYQSESERSMGGSANKTSVSTSPGAIQLPQLSINDIKTNNTPVYGFPQGVRVLSKPELSAAPVDERDMTILSKTRSLPREPSLSGNAALSPATTCDTGPDVEKEAEVVTDQLRDFKIRRGDVDETGAVVIYRAQCKGVFGAFGVKESKVWMLTNSSRRVGNFPSQISGSRSKAAGESSRESGQPAERTCKSSSRFCSPPNREMQASAPGSSESSCGSTTSSTSADSKGSHFSSSTRTSGKKWANKRLGRTRAVGLEPGMSRREQLQVRREKIRNWQGRAGGWS